MTLSTTYRMESPPEPPMAWPQYEQLILAEWRALLESEPPPPELAIQAFLERHPSMIPGAFNAIGLESGHYPRFSGVISQPPLPSYRHCVPDFMWLSQNSAEEEPVLVEIEAPGKRWFTRRGAQTADLTQALNQIAEWKAWFQVPHHVQAFKHFYGLEIDAWRERRFRPAYVLIYGRRSEADAEPRLTAKRAQLASEDVVLMTYDRLRPNPKADQLVCLRANSSGAMRTIAVPPTLRLSPSLADDRARLQDLPGAIEVNSYLKPARKDFLIRRLPYWDGWVRAGSRGVINGADEE